MPIKTICSIRNPKIITPRWRNIIEWSGDGLYVVMTDGAHLPQLGCLCTQLFKGVPSASKQAAVTCSAMGPHVFLKAEHSRIGPWLDSLGKW